jgi:hypothetical protein
MRRLRKSLMVGWLGCWGLVSSGCNRGGSPFDYIPVSGRITYEDGAPIPAGGIRLGFAIQGVPPKDGAFPAQADAVVDAEGNFPRATSYKYGDGLIPGKHKVTVYYATDAGGKLLVPKDYTNPETTPLMISTDELPLVIKVPRP